MFALSNIAAVNESLKAAVMNCVIPPETDNSTPLFILKFLQNKDKSLRVASLWCILNLVYPGCESSSSRIARLKDIGIISQLNTMVNDPCLDCKVLFICITFEMLSHISMQNYLLISSCKIWILMHRNRTVINLKYFHIFLYINNLNY